MNLNYSKYFNFFWGKTIFNQRYSHIEFQNAPLVVNINTMREQEGAAKTKLFNALLFLILYTHFRAAASDCAQCTLLAYATLSQNKTQIYLRLSNGRVPSQGACRTCCAST